MRSTTDPDIAAVVICTREVSVGMLFAQARQVMREYEAVSSRPREYEVASAAREDETVASEPRDYGAASPESREPEAAEADPLAANRD
jgi:hypothetical protein